MSHYVCGSLLYLLEETYTDFICKSDVKLWHHMWVFQWALGMPEKLASLGTQTEALRPHSSPSCTSLSHLSAGIMAPASGCQKPLPQQVSNSLSTCPVTKTQHFLKRQERNQQGRGDLPRVTQNLSLKSWRQSWQPVRFVLISVRLAGKRWTVVMELTGPAARSGRDVTTTEEPMSLLSARSSLLHPFFHL